MREKSIDGKNGTIKIRSKILELCNAKSKVSETIKVPTLGRRSALVLI